MGTFTNDTIDHKGQIWMAIIFSILLLLWVLGTVNHPSLEQQTKQTCSNAVKTSDPDSLAACQQLQERTNSEYLCKSQGSNDCWLEVK